MKKSLFLLFLFTNSIIFSQIKMSGKITDSIGTPLELANIILINSESNSLETFAMSDDNGNYKLSLKKNTIYNLQVSYIGMSTFSQTLSTQEKDIFKNFSLMQNNQLDAVELTYEMPVVISGDTLVYDADSFKIHIFELEQGTRFSIYNGREFLRGKKRVKRYECKEVKTGRIYLFSPNAEVIKINS